MPRKQQRSTRVTNREATLVGTVRADGVQVKRAVSTRIEQDRTSVRRPGRMRVVAKARERSAAVARSVGVDDVQRGVPVAGALEHQLPAVRRPRRVDVEEYLLLLRGCGGCEGSHGGEHGVEDGGRCHRTNLRRARAAVVRASTVRTIRGRTGTNGSRVCSLLTAGCRGWGVRASADPCEL